MPGPRATPVLERFWSRVVKQDKETVVGLGPCWRYGGAHFGNKYGQLSLGPGAGNTTAHRFSYELHNGELARGKYACHKCDVKNCVNPGHLYEGDHEDNLQDIVDRKRSSRLGRPATIPRPGELPFNRKLSLELSDRMRSEYATGAFTQQQLAKRYSVSQGTVSATIRRVKNMGAAHEGPRDKRNYRRKLRPDDIQSIKDLYATGQFTQQQIAERFGCDQTYVSLIVRGKK